MLRSRAVPLAVSLFAASCTGNITGREKGGGGPGDITGPRTEALPDAGRAHVVPKRAFRR